MILIMQFIYMATGEDNLPKFHQKLDLTESWDHALIQVVEYTKECKRNFDIDWIHCFNWWVESREDVGI